MCLQSIYYPEDALHDKIHMTFVNSHMFRHWGTICRELLHKRCSNQTANVFCSLLAWAPVL